MTAVTAKPRRLSDYDLTGPYGAQAVEKGLADAKWYASPVPKDKMRELLQRRNGPAIRDTLIWFALLAGLGFAGFKLWGTWWAILPFFFYGFLYASVSDSRWHESGHGTAFKTDWMNNAVYEIASFMVSRESVVWRWSHTRHHSDTIIVGRDAEIGGMRPVSIPKMLLRTINYPYIFRFYAGLVRHAFGRMAPAEKMFVPESEFPRIYLRARIYLLIYAIVIALAVITRSVLPLMFMGLPSFYGAWLQIIYGIQQHAGLAEDVLDHRLNTRTVYLNPINRYLYWNMGYHIEHHMFPMVPYYNLAKLHALIKDDCPRPFHGLLDVYRETIPALIRQSKDPDYFIRREVPPPSKAAEAHAAAGAGPARVVISQARPDADGWVEVCELDSLVPGDAVRFEYNANPYAIYRTSIGQLYASDERCTHGNGSLADGYLQGLCIECPKHNGRFDVRDGTVMRPPPKVPVKTYAVREKGGKVLLKVG